MKLICRSIFALIFLCVMLCLSFLYIPISHNARIKLNEEVVLVEYNRQDNKVTKSEFPAGSEIHIILNNWLSENSTDWNHSLNTYASDVAIYSEGISINIHDTFVVINYAQFSDSRHTQLIKDMDVKEFKHKLLNKLL